MTYNPRHRLLTTKQVTDLLGIGSSTLRVWKHRGKVTPHSTDPDTGEHEWLEYDVLCAEQRARSRRHRRPAST